MDGSVRTRLGLRLWPLRRSLLARRPRRAVLMLALLLSLAPWLPEPRPPAASAYAARSVSLPTGSALVGVAVDPNLGRAFVADAGDEVWALDGRGSRLLGVSSVVTSGANAPSGAMAVDVARHRVYVADLAGQITAVDGRTGVPDLLWAGKPTFGLALDVVADRLLVAQPGEHMLVALDAGRGQVVANVPLAEPPGAVAVDVPARRVYVAAAAARRLAILDADTYRPISVIALPGPADALAVDTTTHRVYAADAASGAITSVEGRTNTIVATLQVGYVRPALALNPATGHLFIADAGADDVAVVDTRRKAIVATVPVAGPPVALAVDPRIGLVYVASDSAIGQGSLLSGRRVTVLRDDGPSLALLAAFGANISVWLGR